MNPQQEAQFLQDLNQHAGILHRICRSYLSEAEERQDAFQEMVYQLWKSYAGFNGEAKFSTWMYKVALNTVFGYLRQSKKAIQSEPLTDLLSEKIPAEEPTPDKTQSLYNAINTLSAIDKAIILLYLDDNSYDEIATVMGITKTNVSVRLVRIKKKLEEKLKNNL